MKIASAHWLPQEKILKKETVTGSGENMDFCPSLK